MKREKREADGMMQTGTEETTLVRERPAGVDTLLLNNINGLQNGHDNKIEILQESAESELMDRNREVKVAILSEDGFEEVELTGPKQALENAGFTVEVISPHNGIIKGWNETNWGKEVPVDRTLHDAKAYEYDALVLPGGVMNPDKLRQNRDAIVFLKQFINSGKPVAAICHGAQTLIETGMLEGRTMTSYPSLKTDLRNAGVKWVDKEMVHSGQFITSRRPADLDSFNRELIYSLTLQEH